MNRSIDRYTKMEPSTSAMLKLSRMVTNGDTGMTYILHDHIVGRYSVARNEQQCVVVYYKEIPNFTRGNFGKLALEIDIDK